MTATPLSFEFYPPKTDDQRAQLGRTVKRLKAHAPEFVSVTFGAGGSTLSYTPETVRELRQAHALNGVPELHFYTLNLSKPTEAVLARL